MRKLMMMLSALMSVSTTVGLAAMPQVELAARVELASFGEISKKVSALGAMINNPIVPALLLGGGQQQLVQKYGGFRGNSPIHGLVYVRTAAMAEAARKESFDGVDELLDFVIVYPSVNGLAKMALNHPGSTKEADGTLHLLASENSPEDRWVKFTDDGRYCAFADSAGLAVRAAEDFSKLNVGRVTAQSPALLQLEMNECGLKTALALEGWMESSEKREEKVDAAVKSWMLSLLKKQGERQRRLLGNYSKLMATVNLDETGLTLDCRMLPRQGAKMPPAAGFRLPVGALDVVPAGAPLFAAMNLSLSGGHLSEAEFREDCADAAKVLREEVIAEVKKTKDAQKYGALLDEVGAALEAYLLAIPYPSVGDWSVGALAFDGEHHPYGVCAGDCSALPLCQNATRACVDRLFAAVERQWPGRGLAIRNSQDVYTFDWGALIDVAAAESDVGAQHAKEVANAKKTLEALLGSTKTVCSSTTTSSRVTTVMARPEYRFPSSKGLGEDAIAKALPETVKDRPAGVFYLQPYALARDVLLPIVAKLSDKETAAQYRAMLAGMAPSAPNSAFAAAGWVDADGTMRGLFRVTAGEIRNLGAAFNAFTAASMSSISDEDDDK